MTMQNLKRAYQLFSTKGSKTAEIRDSANQNRVVFAGTYAECVAYAKSRGFWYS